MKDEHLNLDRICGTAVSAAVGDALGMPLESRPPRSADALERHMRAGRLPPGTFTDDTEMTLAVAESLLTARPLDPADLAHRFVAWLQAGPDDVGTVVGALAGAAYGLEAIPTCWRSALRGVWPIHRSRPEAIYDRL